MRLDPVNSKGKEKPTFIQVSPPKGFNIALCNFQAYIFNSIIFRENGGYQNDRYYPQHSVTEKQQGQVPCEFLLPSRISSQTISITSFTQEEPHDNRSPPRNGNP